MPFPAINPHLDRALAEQGYVDPTPVQLAVLEADAADRDLLVSAQTGSGKTVAYGLAMAPTILGPEDGFPTAGPPLALIVAPTRELAMQVHRELTWLYAPAGGRLVTCVGGMDARREQRALAGGAHIVVGTPGRLRDHLERGNLDASALEVVVLDEADEMLDLGFREDLEFILDAAPEDRRTLLFSATIAKDIAALAQRFQKQAVRIDTTVANEPHGDIEYRVVRVAPNEVEHAVVNVLRFFEAPGALVFCSTRESVRRLHAALLERGFAAVALSGELTQNERTNALQSLRDGRARVCVATDVAARGLDLPDLGLVIHAELPINRATLLHRSGRTGRAGRKGVSVLMAPYNRARKAEMLLHSAGLDATWEGPPAAEEIRRKDQERLLADPLLSEESSEEELALARALLQDRGAEEIAAALIRMHRSRLPAPEEVFQAGPPQRAYGARERGERAREGDAFGAPRLGDGDVVWFRLNVGRAKNADPKWLLPLICRLGHVTKRDIGKITIFDRDTRFGIAAEAAERFAQAADGAAEGGVRITRADEGPRPPRKPYGSPRDGAEATGARRRDRETSRDDAEPRASRKPYGTARREDAAPDAADFKPWNREVSRADGERPAARKSYGTKADARPAERERKPWERDGLRGGEEPRPTRKHFGAKPERDVEAAPKQWDREKPRKERKTFGAGAPDARTNDDPSRPRGRAPAANFGQRDEPSWRGAKKAPVKASGAERPGKPFRPKKPKKG
jgi:ATP-dependent RNA helicase DeaD